MPVWNDKMLHTSFQLENTADLLSPKSASTIKHAMYSCQKFIIRTMLGTDVTHDLI